MLHEHNAGGVHDGLWWEYTEAHNELDGNIVKMKQLTC